MHFLIACMSHPPARNDGPRRRHCVLETGHGSRPVASAAASGEPTFAQVRRLARNPSVPFFQLFQRVTRQQFTM